MNKAELIVEVAGKVGIVKKDTANVINAFTETVTDSLSNGEKVTLVGFGSFQVMERKARRRRNPQTRKEIQIPAKKVPTEPSTFDFKEPGWRTLIALSAFRYIIQRIILTIDIF